jgi:hypothetical protein
MRPIGFSTGSLAYGEFRMALDMLKGKPVDIVELSALRSHELAPLIESLDSLDLSRFSYVSVHAPSNFGESMEGGIARLLGSFVARRWPLILHPDAIYDYKAWLSFGDLLLIENMDKRKPRGRTAEELAEIFDRLPQASLCFDLGHGRQVDPTMNTAYMILREFGDRLRQVHVSEVNTRSTHDRLTEASIAAFQKVADLIPESVPVILETPVTVADLDKEISQARRALPVKTAALALA